MPVARPAARSRVVVLGVLSFALLAGAMWFTLGRRAPEPPVAVTSGLDPAIAQLMERSRCEVKASPRSGEAWGRLATVWLHAQFNSEAEWAFARAERYSPRDARWPYLHGILLKEDQPEAAVARFEAAVRLCGDQPDAPRLRLARLLLERGRLDEAEAQFQSLLRREPTHPPALLGLARIRLAQGRAAESAGLLSRCADDRHVARSAQALSAQVQRHLGHAEMADAASRALDRMPPDTAWPDPYWTEALQYRVGKTAWLEQAQALIDAGRLEAALEALNRIAKDYPDDGESRYLMGWILNREGQGSEAERSLREHLRLSPQSPKGLAQLAVALLAQERYAEAIEVLRQAIQVKPTWAELHFNLGYALTHLGRKDEAIAGFREALRYDPNYVDAYITLADLLIEKGGRDEAAGLLRQALLLNPGDERVRILQRRIGQRE